MHKELHKNCTSAEKSQKLTNAKYGAISTGSEIIIGNFQTETMWYGKGHAGGEIAGEGKQKSRGYAGYWTGGERNELLLAILCRFPIMAHCCPPVISDWWTDCNRPEDTVPWPKLYFPNSRNELGFLPQNQTVSIARERDRRLIGSGDR